MNFKIYVEKDLDNSITSIDDYIYSEVTIDNYEGLINNHLASKISQNFIFFVTKEMLDPLFNFMMEHKKSKFQFVILGSVFTNDLKLPIEYVLGCKKRSITKYEFSWYLTKFKSYIKNEKMHKKVSVAEAKDVVGDQNELISIGQMLAEERDRDKLIQKILLTSLKITGADAGSVFLVVDRDDGSKGLLFKYSYTISREIDFHEFIMDLDEKSIAGFCAYNDEVVNIPDVYNISDEATFSFNRAIDEKYDYISRSMLAIPMKNHLDEMLGVIQLINSKEDFGEENNEELDSYRMILHTKEDFYAKIHPFEERYEDIMLSVAGQASIALDNAKMIQQLKNLFEGMVRASVDAIDSKDPATSGHSFRVAKMSVKFLECINNTEEGVFSSLSFLSSDIQQMEYAALLHDYGKVYIDNSIFLKAKKLFPKDFNILMLRLDLIIQTIKNLPSSKENELKVQNVLEIREKIHSLNEPRIFHENPKEIIDEILRSKNDYNIFDGDNNPLPLLTEKEIVNLQIVRGTLNDKERKEIESHVVYTTDFLKSIPWPKELSRIPSIAGGHHEMLNGTGYPNKLTAKDLSIESKILAVLDIFDALSASDRPYKSAVPFEKVKKILYEEVASGRLDKDLVEFFFDNKIYDGLYS